MSERFTVEIISPDRSIIKTDTKEVVIPSYEGEMGILKDHIPFKNFRILNRKKRAKCQTHP